MADDANHHRLCQDWPLLSVRAGNARTLYLQQVFVAGWAASPPSMGADQNSDDLYLPISILPSFT
jgi:hypothetical protein